VSSLNRRARRAVRKANLDIMKKSSSGRSCGTCTLCCTLFAIDELAKPEGQTCRNLRPERGDHACSRYPTRPRVCVEFYCLWRQGEFTEQSRPDKIGAAFLAMSQNGMTWLVGLAIDEAAISRMMEPCEALWRQTSVPIVLKIANSTQTWCWGTDTQLVRLNQIYGTRPRRLPVVDS